ncbi:S1C family serine protease [Agrobacterium sp. ES01]|uniref:S1C family serine protease n=1 Tax=Agrobacterium sp. ES01 TaxID=3420714 RepID=UPI003D0CDDF1
MNITDILRSVVAVHANIPEDAFTADTLGIRREGSGVVIRENGLVLTIGYLVTEADDIWLTRDDGHIVPAHVVAYDQQSGFGLVQALGDLGAPPLELGDSDLIDVGDRVFLSDGMGQTVPAGIVAKQEFAGYWEYLLDEAIFISPAHPSWGGAALVDEDGRLIGIGSLRLQMSQGSSVSDINMAVPINLLKPILEDLMALGQVDRPPRPWLGAYSAENNGRVIVMNVSKGSPAEVAGLQQGDIISEIRDVEVEGLADLYRKVWDSGQAGVEIPMRIIRDGRDTWLRVKSADRGSFLKKPQIQ